MSDRRNFLRQAALLGAAAGLQPLLGCARNPPLSQSADRMATGNARGDAPATALPPAPPLISATQLTRRPAAERGGYNHDWLHTQHSFSFGRYQDPKHMSFRALRVLNEDRVKPGQGFRMHGHRDMEIITWVLSGELKHRDSLGNGSIIRPGDAQRMSAGTGIRHSEFEPSGNAPVHFLQIWLLPDQRGHTPGYQQQRLATPSDAVSSQVIASGDGASGSIRIHQDARLSVTRVKKGQSTTLVVPAKRHAWLQVARGAVIVNGVRCDQGDGLATSVSGLLKIMATTDAEVLHFDLA